MISKRIFKNNRICQMSESLQKSSTCIQKHNFEKDRVRSVEEVRKNFSPSCKIKSREDIMKIKMAKYIDSKESSLPKRIEKLKPISKSPNNSILSCHINKANTLKKENRKFSNSPEKHDDAQIDIVNLQNEIFSRMFVEDALSPSPDTLKIRKDDLKLNTYKSMYPRSQIPKELKNNFDLVSDGFNYNDEFWKYKDVKKFVENPNNKNTLNNITSKNRESKMSHQASQNFISSFSASSLKQDKNNAEIFNKQRELIQMKSNWISKIIKIKEDLDK